MPVMDGLKATERIRQIEAERRAKDAAEPERTPIIAMTADAMKSDRERCLEAGMDDYLAKPVDPGMLMATLRQWLSTDSGSETISRMEIRHPQNPSNTETAA